MLNKKMWETVHRYWPTLNFQDKVWVKNGFQELIILKKWEMGNAERDQCAGRWAKRFTLQCRHLRQARLKDTKWARVFEFEVPGMPRAVPPSFAGNAGKAIIIFGVRGHHLMKLKPCPM